MEHYAQDKSAKSNILGMNLAGKVGETVREYEEKWVHTVFDTHDQIFNIYKDSELCRQYDSTGALLYWFPEFVGKMLVGHVSAYRVSADPKTKKIIQELIANIRSIQRPNGYVGPYPADYTLPYAADAWGHYFIIVGLCDWYALTGDLQAIRIAAGAADFIYNSWILPETGEFFSRETGAMNVSMAHGFALLYEHTGDKKYFDAAKQMVDVSWELGGDWLNNALAGKEYCETTSKRWECLHAIMALGELYRISGDERYYTALDRIWWSLLKTDVHSTGGWTTHEFVTGDPYLKGTIETCCTVAWMAFSEGYLKVSKNSYAADELERSYFNAMLGSIVDGKYVTYATNMDAPSRTYAYHADPKNVLKECPDFTCCICNGARGVNFPANWAVLQDDSTLYLNYFGASDIHTLTPGGKNISIKQQTLYPQNGTVKITLSLQEAEHFCLGVRIPFWAEKKTSLKVNGEAVCVKAGEYARITRLWTGEDVLELELDMGVHFLVGDGDCVNLTSAYYGPVLMTLDRAAYSGDFDDTYFAVDAVKHALVGAGDKHWLTFTVKDIHGADVTLVDFASAGRKGSAYDSWLHMEHNMLVMTTQKGKRPAWHNDQSEGRELLQNLVDAGEEKNLTAFTQSSASRLNAAQEKAKALLADKDASGEAIAQASGELHNALFSLVKDYSAQILPSQVKQVPVTLTQDSFSAPGNIATESYNGIKITGNDLYWDTGTIPAVTYKREKLSVNGLTVEFTLDSYPGSKDCDPYVALYLTENPTASAWGVTPATGNGYMLVIPISNAADTTASLRILKVHECAQMLYVAASPSPHTKMGNKVRVQFLPHETLGCQILINGVPLENSARNKPFDLTGMPEYLKDGSAYVSLNVIMGFEDRDAQITWTGLSVE